MSFVDDLLRDEIGGIHEQLRQINATLQLLVRSNEGEVIGELPTLNETLRLLIRPVTLEPDPNACSCEFPAIENGVCRLCEKQSRTR